MSVAEPPAHEAQPDFPDLAAERPADSSLLSAFQRKREELARRGTREERKLVHEWEGALRIVYRYPEGGTDPIIRAVERAQTGGKPSDAFNANADVLIACIHDIEFREPGGDWEPLDSERQTKFTRSLADKLALDLSPNLKSEPRYIARHLFSPKAATTGVFEGDVGLMTQAGEVIRWLNGAEIAADEELRGE